MSLFKRYVAPVSERERRKIVVRKTYVIPLYVAWYKTDPNTRNTGYGLTKERAISSVLKKRKQKRARK